MASISLSTAQRPASSSGTTSASILPHHEVSPAPAFADAPAPQPHLRSHIGLNLGLGGRWWDDSSTIRQLRLTQQQQSRMDSIFESNKPALIALYLDMQREQTRLSTLSSADLQDEAKVFAAIDRVSQARCALEKENARILIRIRQQLGPQQLQVLNRQIATLH
jgi:Spy/CpxP family protein refolding chaperone